jgi:RNA polymerase sigma-70 factor (ECF subfamily)
LAISPDALYRRYGPMVLRRCEFLLRDEEKALDAMHDVFVQLLRHADRLDASAPSSLLHRVATNVCLNRLRHERRKPEDPMDEKVLSVAAAEESAESRTVLRSVVQRLFGAEQESTRTMAVLHLVDGMTLEEVAREVGLSVSGVRKRLRGLTARCEALEGV